MKFDSEIFRYLKTRFQVMVTVSVLVLLLSEAQRAEAWWEGAWQERAKVNLDTSADGADINETLKNVPVLVRLHTGNFNFSDVKADGSDIRFVSGDDETVLKYHIEKFDPLEEIAMLWVSVPVMSAGSGQGFFWIYYGNPSATDAQDPAATYDVNQVAVYHLKEQAGNPEDATAWGNHTSSFSGMAGSPAIIGNGALFASGPGMRVPASSSLEFSDGFTFSAWVSLTRPTSDGSLFSWGDGNRFITAGIDGTDVFASVGTKNGKTVTTEKVSLTPSRWYHLAVTAEADAGISVFLDGVEVVSADIGDGLAVPSGDIVIGSANADMDEVRLSNIARSPGWIKTSFQGQGPDGRLVSYMQGESSGQGEEESLTVHLMKVIARTITLDGWIIIGMLALMGVASIYVFNRKIEILRKARKQNETFFRNFRDVEQPLDLFESKQEYVGSSLYQIYSAGCEELKRWIEKRGRRNVMHGGWSDRAMNRFRAVLEKEAMYESRKLTVGMIIMNLSVSGSPFLGLLGTVWGVMNTFASLAESGEANLMAIAPGVASALACTMAGLVVAIPALFASSYLTGLIRDMNADVNVFIDDFILVMEEEGGDNQ